MTLITRDQMRPGMVVEVRQRYVVKPGRYPAGSKRTGAKMYPTGEPAEFVIVRRRWRVRRRPPFSLLGTPINGAWIAEEQDRRDGEDAPFVAFGDGDPGWYAFNTWAEAITYADRMARQAGTTAA